MTHFLFEDLPACLEPTAREMVAAVAAQRNVLLLSQDPGTGPTLLARRLAGALPELSREDRHACFRNYAAAGLIAEVVERVNPDNDLVQWCTMAPAGAPFRAPHHTIGRDALRGFCSERRATPGEVALAHAGVLYLDTVDDFVASSLEAARDPVLAFPARPRVIVASALEEHYQKWATSRLAWVTSFRNLMVAYAAVRVPALQVWDRQGRERDKCKFTTEEAREILRGGGK